MRTIDADRLIARIMRLSQGDLMATWTAAGLIKIVEEEASTAQWQIASFLPLKSEDKAI